MQKKTREFIKNNSRDQYAVVLEGVSAKLSLILEQFSGLNKGIDDNHREFLGFRDEANASFKEISGFIDRTDKNLKVALEYLFRIDEEIQDMKTELRDLKKIFKEKADLDKLLVFEKRLIKLEKLVFAKLA